MLEVNISDPHLDWGAYDPEDLVTASLVQDPTVTEDGRTVHFALDLADEAEQALRERLNDEQVIRREEHIQRVVGEAMKQFSRRLDKSYSNINANISKLAEEFNSSTLSDIKSNLPSQQELNAATRAATKAARKTMARHSRKLASSAAPPAVEPPETNEAPITSDTTTELVRDPMMVYIEKTTNGLEKLSTVAAEESALRKIEVDKADKRTRIGYFVSGASLFLAALSLIFAIISALNPVTIKQPQDPFPVRVVDPAGDKPVHSP